MRCESEQFQSLAEASSWFLLQAPFPLPLASSFPQAHTSDSLGEVARGQEEEGVKEVFQVTCDWAMQEGAKARQILLIISPSAPTPLFLHGIKVDLR